MNEIYTCLASALRDAGLPASTFIVEQYLSRNDFAGLMSLLRKAQEKCTLAKIMSEPCRAAG